MLYISSSQRYFLFRGNCDMRKGIDGLCGMVRNHLQKDPLTGDVFIFLNRSKDKIKLLCWDRDGYALYCKRLEKGTFELPKNHSDTLSSETLHLIMQGIYLDSVKRRKRYEKSDRSFAHC